MYNNILYYYMIIMVLLMLTSFSTVNAPEHAEYFSLYDTYHNIQEIRKIKYTF